MPRSKAISLRIIPGLAPPGKQLHVVLLNQAFHPDVVATAQMGKDLAEALVARGHRVSAIASRSIYGQKGASLPRREVISVPGGSVEVYRVGMSLFGKAGIASPRPIRICKRAPLSACPAR